MLELYLDEVVAVTFNITSMEEAGQFALNFEEKVSDSYEERTWIFTDEDGKRWLPIGWEEGIAWEEIEE